MRRRRRRWPSAPRSPLAQAPALQPTHPRARAGRRSHLDHRPRRGLLDTEGLGWWNTGRRARRRSSVRRFGRRQMNRPDGWAGSSPESSRTPRIESLVAEDARAVHLPTGRKPRADRLYERHDGASSAAGRLRRPLIALCRRRALIAVRSWRLLIAFAFVASVDRAAFVAPLDSAAPAADSALVPRTSIVARVAFVAPVADAAPVAHIAPAAPTRGPAACRPAWVAPRRWTTIPPRASRLSPTNPS